MGERRLLAGLGLAALAVTGWAAAGTPPFGGGRPGSPAQVQGTGAWDAPLAHAARIDVNTAGVAELERLPGVGRTLARRIVAARRAGGRFGRAADLARVRGIGPRTVEALEERVRVR